MQHRQAGKRHQNDPDFLVDHGRGGGGGCLVGQVNYDQRYAKYGLRLFRVLLRLKIEEHKNNNYYYASRIGANIITGTFF